jgi:hypothetical protein
MPGVDVDRPRARKSSSPIDESQPKSKLYAAIAISVLVVAFLIIIAVMVS